MRWLLFQAATVLWLLSGCSALSSTRPAEVLDERSGMTVGRLQEPIELVQRAPNAELVSGRRTSFAYLGPVEWDRSGDISYGLWIHVAPGNDRQVDDIHSPGAVTLKLDGDKLVLSPIEAPEVGMGPYRPIASWGQSGFFEVNATMLNRMAACEKLGVELRAVDKSVVDFVPSHETRTALTRFVRARGIN